MNEQITRVILEEADKAANREIAEKNEQIREQQIRMNREQAKRLAQLHSVSDI